jgi:hypothetical protein
MLCGRKNFAIQWPKVWKTPYQRFSRSHFFYVGREAVPFMQGSLPALPHCKGNTLVNTSWHARHEKVTSSLDSPCPVHEPEGRKNYFVIWKLSVLQRIHSTGFQSAITGDESWFFLYYSPDSIWASSRDEIPERVSQKTDTQKYRLSLLWSINGIHSLVDFPKGRTYDSAFFCDIVMRCLFDGITLHSRRKSLKGS